MPVMSNIQAENLSNDFDDVTSSGFKTEPYQKIYDYFTGVSGVHENYFDHNRINFHFGRRIRITIYSDGGPPRRDTMYGAIQNAYRKDRVRFPSANFLLISKSFFFVYGYWDGEN
jgi:hypothetical protein